MIFSLYCTNASTQSEKVPDLSRVTPVQLDSMGAAITEAIRLIGDGVIVWKIEGLDGFMMERSDIETERSRRQENRGNGAAFDERAMNGVLVRPPERQRLSP